MSQILHKNLGQLTKIQPKPKPIGVHPYQNLYSKSLIIQYKVQQFIVYPMYQEKSSLISQQEISEKIEIFISGRNLADLDTFTTTDSFVIAYLSEPERPCKQLLKTKIYWNDLNPNYVQTIVMDFVFEIRQKLLFEVYHQAKPPKLVGRLETTVGEIFGSPANGLIRSLKNDAIKEPGKLILRCQKISKGKRRTLNAQIIANNLPNLTWWWFFGGTCPFYRLFRKRKTDELLIYQSQVINYSTNPNWRQIKISEQKICKQDENQELQIRVYNFSSTGAHTIIGSIYFTLADLANKSKFQILSPQKQKKGQIVFQNIKRTIKYQFGDYIENGLQLALVTCIDFTASNGNPQNKDSLHFSTISKKSQYEQAMSEVLDILLDYDYDKLVPVFGFGAIVNHPKFNTYGKVHHCFPLNGNEDNPNIYSKQNILKTYRTIFPYIKLSGPTKFAQLLKEAISMCRRFTQNKQKTQYMILFILTDGQIHDKAQVFDLLIKCNRLPLSVIIVGVGNGDFSIMHQLDDDNCQMMDSQGNKTERDLVQFVEFNKFKNSGVVLAREVLEEVPRQVSQYFELINFSPDRIKKQKGDIEYQMLIDGLDV